MCKIIVKLQSVIITPEFVQKYINKSWYWQRYGISTNPNLSIEFIEKFPDKHWMFGMNGISVNPSLTIEFIEKYPDKQWNWSMSGISQNSLNGKIVELYNKYPNKNWCFLFLSTNPSITMKFIENNIDKLDFRYLSKNKFTHHNNIVKRIFAKTTLFYYLSFSKLIYDIKRYFITFF
jgi:hypothetical protein